MLGSWDVALFRWINAGWSSPALDPVFGFLSVGIKSLALKLVLLGVLAAYFAAGVKTRAAALQAMLAWPIANGITDIFKNQLPNLRPCVELANVTAVPGVPFLHSSGTLSAHAANMAAIATVLFLRLKWQAAPWMVFALLTGLSRVYVGVHYPSQVVFGWLAGAVCGWVVVKTWDAFVAWRNPDGQVDSTCPPASSPNSD